MTPLTVELPQLAEKDILDCGDTHIHLVCCDPGRALCGADVSGGDADDDATDDETCLRCLIIDDADLPCGAVFCRARQWWRERRPT